MHGRTVGRRVRLLHRERPIDPSVILIVALAVAPRPRVPREGDDRGRMMPRSRERPGWTATQRNRKDCRDRDGRFGDHGRAAGIADGDVARLRRRGDGRVGGWNDVPDRARTCGYVWGCPERNQSVGERVQPGLREAARHGDLEVAARAGPSQYFSVFTETAHVVLASIQHGLTVDAHTVPDISVGMMWSKHWKDLDLDTLYGARTKYPHVYPPDYPQSAADPDAFIYPIAALGEFRRWLSEIYLPQKYPTYLRSKVKGGAIPASRVELLIAAVQPLAIGPGDA